MKLIDDYVERFHNYELPSAEKCLVIENGDEVYIKKWILNGKINGKARDMFEWIEKKYLNEKSILKEKDPLKFKNINERFLMNKWRLIILFSEYQIRYRYYSKAIISIKGKSYSEMQSNDFFKLFEK
tara:strand:- start:102 stop:482 length:381 start_codon:yes stop_codon:yes gene_type:complete